VYISLSVADAKTSLTTSIASASVSGVTASCRITSFLHNQIKDETPKNKWIKKQC